MKLYILSRRHQERGWTCDGCQRGVNKKRAVAVIAIKDGSTIIGELRVCGPCAREIARSAEPAAVRP